MNYAYISNGKLHISTGGKAPVEIQSEFADQVISQHGRAMQKHQWKSASSGDGPMQYSLWNSPSGETDTAGLVEFTSVTVSPDPDLIYYFIRTSAVGGLFRYDMELKEETRVFHRENMDLCDLRHHPEDSRILCSAAEGFGRSIAVIPTHRFQVDFLTEGDSFDVCPFWSPVNPDLIVYQSSGIGRNQQGQSLGMGNASIIQLNTRTGSMETLLEDDSFDFLCPFLDKSGNLYCIRRPYNPAPFTSHMQAFKDFFMIPVRLLKSLFGFLNMITQIFAKESLINATTGKKTDVDLRYVFIKGRQVDMRNLKTEDEGSVVPSDWELIKRVPDGSVQTVATKVSDFSISPQGDVFYTNGYSLFRLVSGDSQRIHKGKELLDSVVAL